jgi:hypothetical protein
LIRIGQKLWKAWVIISNHSELFIGFGFHKLSEPAP